MDEPLPLFLDSETCLSNRSAPIITDSQRAMIRNAFAELGVTAARDQFAMVQELIGDAISSVQQLRSDQAQRLIYALSARVRDKGRQYSGRPWDDRQEDTWIDKI